MVVPNFIIFGQISNVVVFYVVFNLMIVWTFCVSGTKAVGIKIKG